jgi:hypothetical protein
MMGPGKYDGLCTLVREQAKARGAAVIIWGGDQGSGAGFSVQADPEDMAMLANILENMADCIREGQKGVQSGDGSN